MRSRLVVSALLFSAAALAQQGGGSITGTVTDQQDAVIAGAAIQIRNTNTNATFRAASNESGAFVAPSLPVGEYEISAEAAGFKRTVLSGITLQVNQTANLNVRLEIGQVAESVEVVGESPLVNTSNATVGEVIENRRVRDLPLNGRGALALTLLTAGVMSNAGPTNSGFGDRGIQISSLSINGSPSSMNNQMLDGSNNILSYVGEVGVPPAVDAVEEFKVQSGSMSSEFGFTAGGTINLVTKSGTNRLHGSAYEFLRNDTFDARNTFARTKLPLRYNQFGGTIGGPFIKDRTFGFFNYEKYLLRRSSPRIATMPIAEFRSGDFSRLATASGAAVPVYDPATTRANPAGSGLVRDVFPGNIVPRNRFDPITPKILDFYPLPNKTPTNQFTFAQNFQDAGFSRVDWTQWNFKVDHRFNDKNSIFLRYTSAQHAPYADSFFTDPNAGGNRSDDQTNRNAVVSDTHTFSPTLINNLRVGVMRQLFFFTAVNFNQGWPRKLGLPEIVPNDQMPQINFGFGTIGGGAAGTRGSFNWDIQDTLTKIAGDHTLKFGYNHRILQGGNLQGAALSGSYTFGGLTNNPQRTAGTGSDMAQFLLGEVSSAGIDRILGNSFHGLAISTFVQDDWRLSRRLTLNLGLRWDWQQKPYERHDGHINFDYLSTSPVSGLQGQTVYAGVDGQPRSFLGEDYNDFGPRLGFAFDIFGTGKTVLRGGYGIFYPSIFYRAFTGNVQLFSSTRTNYVAQGPGLRSFLFRDGLPRAPLGSPGSAAGPDALLGQSVQAWEEDPTTPRTQQWNLSVQQQVGEWLLDATYAANKGNHFLASGYNLNQLPVDQRRQLGQSLFDRVPNPLRGLVPGGFGAATVTRERTLLPFPHYNGVSIRNPRYGNYMSHQLQINVKRRMTNGFLVHFAYTAGKKISDSVAVPVDFGAVEQTNENGFQDNLFNRQLNRSVDPTDVSQRGVVSLLYELPFGKGKAFSPDSAVLNKIVGGWQINSIGVMQTGIPLTVRGASNFQADRPNSTGVSAKIDNPTRERWFNTDAFINPPDFTYGTVGRTLPDARHPGTVNWDLSLIKDTLIGERVNVQFRAEAFNFMNITNLGLANDSFSAGPDGKNRSATFGTVASARDARVIQFGLKLIF
ncbi:MAG: carboxypeptidase regulatory-like domain-containing protein [Bryobacteraceae bacterium]